MFELRSFGPPALYDPVGRPVDALMAQPKRLILLTYLAVGHPDGCRRDLLLALFWPESSESKARNALRQSLALLRKHVGTEALPELPGGVLRVDPARLRSDAFGFDRALAAEDLPGALALYRGEFLAGIHLSGLSEVESWIEERRATTRRRAVRAALRLADQGGAGDSSVALSWAHRAVQLAPLDEPAWRKLIALQIARGDGAGALASYERMARSLAEEFGVSPAPETVALVAPLRGRAVR